MRKLRRACLRKISTGLGSLVILAGGYARADSIYSFEDLPLGTATTFSEISNGVTATFSSTNSAMPGAFDIEVNPAGIGSGQRLIETNAAANDPNNTYNLLVNFNSTFVSATFPFAIREPIGSVLTLSAFLNGTLVSSVSAPANTPFNSYSIGSLSYNAPVGQDFDSLLLSTNGPGFAIDDLDVAPSEPAGVSEPSLIVLMILGLAGTLFYVRRYHRRQLI